MMVVTKNGKKMKTMDLKENPLLEVSVNSLCNLSSLYPELSWKEIKNKLKKCLNTSELLLNKKNKN